MPLRAIYDIFLHLDMFKNVDLVQRGLYQIRINMYYEIPEIGTKIYAAPYYVGNFQKSSNNFHNNDILNKPFIMEDEFTFCSRYFPIVYCSEVTNLSEYAQFRIEVEMIENFQNIPIYITFSLYFSEFENKAEYNISNKPLSFTEIGSSKFILYNFFQGFSKYIPVIFGDFFYSLVDSTIHSSLVEFKATKNFIEINQENEVCKIVKSIPDSIVKKDPIRKGSKYLLIINQELLINSKNLQIELNHIIGKFSLLITKLIKKYSNLINKKPERSVTDPALISKIALENCVIRPPLDPMEANKVFLPNPSIVGMESLQTLSRKSKNKENLLENNLESSLSKLYINYQKIIGLIKNNSHAITRYLATKFLECCRNRMKDYIFDDHYSKKEERIELAENFWKSNNYLFWGNINPLEIKLFGDLSNCPLIFEKSESPKLYYSQDNLHNAQTAKQTKYRLFVFCHGFKGSSYDLNLLKNNLALIFFDSMFLLCEIDESECESDINKMGKKVANDLLQFLEDKGINSPSLEINFFGHSLGGLVIRSALPFLEKYKKYMNTFVTLGTPHLGMKYHNSKLISAGIWILQKFTHWNCLKQLNMTDHSDYKESYLYKLSQAENLLWFKNLILISSSQDSFVPYNSSRIETSINNNKECNDDQAYLEMAKNLNYRINKIKVLRLDVNFRLPKK